jgi:hypothetical protein
MVVARTSVGGVEIRHPVMVAFIPQVDITKSELEKIEHNDPRFSILPI